MERKKGGGGGGAEDAGCNKRKGKGKHNLANIVRTFVLVHREEKEIKQRKAEEHSSTKQQILEIYLQMKRVTIPS